MPQQLIEEKLEAARAKLEAEARERQRKSQISDRAMCREIIRMYRDSDPEQAKATERFLAQMEERAVEEWARA